MFIGCIGHFRTACKNFNKLRAQLGTYEDLNPPPRCLVSGLSVHFKITATNWNSESEILVNVYPRCHIPLFSR